MEDGTREDRLEATVRDKAACELKLQIATDEGNEARVAELKDELASINASIKFLSGEKKTPAKRTTKAAPKTEKR